MLLAWKLVTFPQIYQRNIFSKNPVKGLGSRVDLSSLSSMMITYYFGWDCLTLVALGNSKHFMVF